MIDGRFRFDSFVSGQSNHLAASASCAVAEAPGKAYNPLFIYAEPGQGKTHLLGALGFHASQLHPELAVRYRGAEDFAVQFRVAMQRGEHEAWRREWAALELVMLDDVHLLEEHPEAQAELQWLIADATRRRVQFVLTCDRPPGELEGFNRDLLASMSAGLIVDIAPPELEARRAILKGWAWSRGLVIDASNLEQMAAPDADSVRQLLSTVSRLHPGAKVSGAVKAVVAEARKSGSMRAVVTPGRTEPPNAAGEFDSFLNEISAVVTQSVEQWRARLAGTVARWVGEGYSTDSLERFLEGVEAPDVDAIEAHFATTVHQLRDLEQEAARLDPKLAGVAVFRDPARLDEARAIVMRALAAYDPPPGPAGHLTIGALMPGARNQLALRAAGEVIALPGSRYNPLFIHGPASSGKTHLAHAIANALGARDGGAWTVAVVDGAALGEELIEALRTGSLERWRMRYRAADALVVDNVQRIGGSDRLQDEFFSLFNAFIETGRQVILTSEAPPARLSSMAARLQSSFETGLVVEIGLVSEAEAVARHTPVPDGDEAAAPTIDAWFEDAIEPEPARPAVAEPSSGVDSFFLDPEKVITDWPGLDGRVVEEVR